MSILGNMRKALKGTGTEEPVRSTPRRRRPPRRAVEATEDELPDGFVVSTLLAVDESPEEHREEDTLTHVSTLIYAPCPRRFALVRKYKPEIPRLVQRGQRIIWAMGRAAETHARGSMKVGAPNEMYGGWTCKCEGSKFTGTFTQALDRPGCERCGTLHLDYKEHTLTELEHETVGNPDLLLLRGVTFTVVEFKSVNAKGFSEVESKGRPTADNAHQALYYRRMLVRNGVTVSPFVILVYVLKEYKWGKLPYQEFQVSESDRGSKASLNLMDSTAKDMKEVRSNAKLIPARLGACREPTSPRAKGCPTCTLCFNLRG